MKTFSNVLLLSLLCFVFAGYSADPADKAIENSRLTVTFKNGGALTVDYATRYGTIARLANEFLNVKPDTKPQEFSYRTSEHRGNGKVVIDLREINSLKIEEMQKTHTKK